MTPNNNILKHPNTHIVAQSHQNALITKALLQYNPPLWWCTRSLYSLKKVPFAIPKKKKRKINTILHHQTTISEEEKIPTARRSIELFEQIVGFHGMAKNTESIPHNCRHES